MKLVAQPESARGGSARTSRGLVLGIAVLAVALGGGVGVALHALLQRSPSLVQAPVMMRHGLYGDETWAVGAAPAPAINGLRDQTGSRFALSSLHGHSVALVFFDSYC
ncbi:MAG: hypothetical protein ACRDKL_00100, partial [Solirubrobacteraceae bacterium]